MLLADPLGLVLTAGLTAGTVSLPTTETMRRGIVVSDGTKLSIAVAVKAPRVWAGRAVGDWMRHVPNVRFARGGLRRGSLLRRLRRGPDGGLAARVKILDGRNARCRRTARRRGRPSGGRSPGGRAGPWRRPRASA
ncbi:hypothetical protein [Actinomadura monticuli]|uniref:Uncharacterized protein n=1 Tax=Actinomadura monticuli TaxID=3097367 RepID=A0ABV4QLD1_9ACTN